MVNIKEYSDKIYALRELPIPRLISESNKIIDDLTREICNEYEIPFELPAMILLRVAKQRLFDDHWCILFRESELEFIVKSIRRDVDSLLEKYSKEIVQRAFTRDEFARAAQPSLNEALYGGIELMERACKKIIGGKNNG